MSYLGTLKPSTYILAIIVFTFVILSGVTMMAELRKSDPTFMAGEEVSQFNSTFNTYSDLETSIDSLQISVTSSQSDWGILGVLNSLAGAAWNGLILLFTSLNFMSLAFAGLSIFGVPSWVGGLMSFAVVVVIAFAIWSAIFRAEV